MKNVRICMLSLGMVILSLVTTLSFAQEVQNVLSKPSIAVALPKIDNLEVNEKVIAKLIQIELIKLDKYSVYDEFDIQEAMDSEKRFSTNCYGKNCLVDLGKAVDAKYIVSSSILSFGGRIVFTTKIIDVLTGEIYKSGVKEFIDNEKEFQRMIEVVINDLHGIELHPQTIAAITYDQQPVIKEDVGRINNAGPRIGYAMLTGRLDEFARRSEREGGLDIFPGVSMIGYQFEKQYIGTDNFAALVEVIPMVSGLEQGVFIPSIILMNGFRFGKKGWEFAFGPGFGISRTSNGFFDNQGLYGEANKYWTVNQFDEAFNSNIESEAEIQEPDYPIDRHLDARGEHFELNTRWVMGIGRTFRVGGLNVPVNIFYSNMKKAGMLGVSVGFNIVN